MSPSLALLLWLILLIGLLCFDPAETQGTSLALWVPLIWMFIVATRLPSQWLGDSQTTSLASQALEEGNSTDRSVFILLVILSIVVLVSRSFQWRTFLTLNRA